MHAVIETRGRQFLVRSGDRICLEGVDHQSGDEVTFDRVLAMGDNLGSPVLEGASVRGKVVSVGRGPKIYIQKFKRRKNYRRRTGFRTSIFEVVITDLVGSN